MSRHPLVKWSQRSDKLFITVELPDAKNVKLNLDPEGKFHFSANAPDNTLYEIDMDLHDKIDVNETKANFTSRHICYLVKKAESKWWSRLLKQEGKPPVFLKVDWDKWVDEDEQDAKAGSDFGDLDFSDLSMGSGGGFDEDAEAEDESGDIEEDKEEEKGTTAASGSASNK